MTSKQMILLKLMEECDELSQRASKAIRFTLLEIQESELENPRSLNNAERLVEEFKDLYVVMEMLKEQGDIKRFIPSPEEEEHRRERIHKYLEYSRKLGTLKDE